MGKLYLYIYIAIVLIAVNMRLWSADGVQKEMHEAQISKLHDEMARLRELLVECRGKERETQSIVNDLRLSLSDLQNLVRLPRHTEYDRSICDTIVNFV